MRARWRRKCCASFTPRGAPASSAYVRRQRAAFIEWRVGRDAADSVTIGRAVRADLAHNLVEPAGLGVVDTRHFPVTPGRIIEAIGEIKPAAAFDCGFHAAPVLPVPARQRAVEIDGDHE